MRLKKLCALLLAVVLTLGLCSCSIGKKGKYEKAVDAVRNGRYQEAIESLEALDGYEDSAKYITYARALQAGDSGDYETAIKALEALNGFEKSAVYITSYTTLAYEAEQARMKSAYNQAIADVKAGNYDAAIAAFETLNDYEDSGKYIMYARCLKAGDSGDYETAVKSLKALGDFKEAGMYIKYYTALAHEAAQEYEAAGEVYEEILLFKDAQARAAVLPDKILDRELAEADRLIGELKNSGVEQLKELVNQKYTTSDTQMYENIMVRAGKWSEKQNYGAAAALYLVLKEAGYEPAVSPFGEAMTAYVRERMAEGRYGDAEWLIEEYLSDHEEANSLKNECDYQVTLERQAWGSEWAQYAYDAFKALGDYKDSAERAAAYENQYAEAVSKREAGEFDAAIALFTELGSYSDSSAQVQETENAKAYAAAVSLMVSEKYEEAITAFNALNGYSDSTVKIDECNAAILEREYRKALELMTNEKYEDAIQAFEALNGYSDSAAKIDECNAAILERKYQKALKLVADEKYEEAVKAFEALNGYSDSATKISECKYAAAASLMSSEKYEEAIEAFKALNGYSDSATKINECNTAILEREYQKALKLMNEEKYERAIKAFEVLNGYSNSTTKINECKTAILEREYQKALKLMNEEKYERAIKAFEVLNGYSDSTTKINECKTAILEREYQKALKLMTEEKYEEAIKAFEVLNGYSDSTTKISECKTAILERDYQKATRLMEDEKYEEAITTFYALKNYKDSATQILECDYRKAVDLMNDKKFDKATELFSELNGYSDSTTQIVECTYRKAGEFCKSGKYDEAYAIYLTIPEYKNVSEILKTDKNLLRVKFKAGNSITLGNYPQTKAGNDNTPIEWMVLENDGETALLISRYELDCKPYNEKYEDTTWEKCTLRSWLNNEFYNRAFSTEEKQYILQSNVRADKNPEYSTNPGNMTKDRVFLLSVVEANKFFKSDDARMCALTDYAIQQGAYTSDDWKVEGRKTCWWWLRSPGRISSHAACVSVDGSMYNYLVDDGKFAVRPCVRVRLF